MDVIARYTCAGLTDAGRKRDNNEDRFHADPDRGIFFVIDGVGGQNAGEKAAEVAYNLLRARLERQTGTVEERIREAITVANNEIHAIAETQPEWQGMGCVLTAAVLVNGQVTIGHVGDSRLYIIQNGEIRKLTHDHSPVGEREDRGEIDELSAMRHPRRNEVFRDVGSQQHSPEDEDFIELITAPFPPSGALLLCTDGLSDLVDSTQILSIIERYAKDPQLAARALIDAANEAGGKDNVTVIVVHGRDFASSTRSHFPTVEMPLSRVVVPQRRPAYLVAGVSLLAGLLLAGLLVAALKPHWRDTGSGTIFGWGAVREPRIWRVQSDINTAMRQARPGDTVLVAPGSYFEQLQLREGVAVVSEAPGQAVLDGQGVAVTADGVRGARIEGFRIIAGQRQPLTVGIQVTDSDVQVVDVEITGAQTSGIEILGNSSGTFRANNVSGNPGTGVVIRDYAKPRLVHNTIANNGRGAGSPRPGVEVSGSAQPVLQANIFSNNAAEAIWATQLNVEALLRQNFSLSEERPRTRPRVRPAK